MCLTNLTHCSYALDPGSYQCLVLGIERRSLRHSAMVANFLNDNKSKRHLKSGLTLFQLHQSYFISFNLS